MSLLEEAPRQAPRVIRATVIVECGFESTKCLELEENTELWTSFGSRSNISKFGNLYVTMYWNHRS